MRYWRRRATELEELTNETAYQTALKTNRTLAELHREISSKIQGYINQYGVEGAVDPKDANIPLTQSETHALKMSLAEHIRRAKELNSLTPKAFEEQKKLFKKLHAQRRVSRLEGFLFEVEQVINENYSYIEATLEKSLVNVYEDRYYRTGYNFQKYIGYTSKFGNITEQDLADIQKVKAFGKNYSARVWGENHRDYVAKHITKLVREQMITGASYKTLESKLQKITQKSRSNVRRLVRTECAHYAELGNQKAFKEMKVERYEILATLDSKTSKTCRNNDKKTYLLVEWLVGVTAPPFHAYCRTTVVPAIDEEDEDFFKQFDEQSRFAKLPNGERKLVRDLSYSEWRKTLN